MEASVRPRVKICCISSVEEAELAIRCGASALGLVSSMPSGPGIGESIDVPIFLAGGLNAGNVAEAVEQVGPFGLDVCSGVRIDGRLDEAKLVRFFNAI